MRLTMGELLERVCEGTVVEFSGAPRGGLADARIGVGEQLVEDGARGVARSPGVEAEQDAEARGGVGGGGQVGDRGAGLAVAGADLGKKSRGVIVAAAYGVDEDGEVGVRELVL